MKRVIPHLITALTAIAILILSLGEPGPVVPKFYRLIPHADKLVHFIMYLGFTVVLLFLYCRKKGNLDSLLITGAISFSYSVFIEFLQKYLTRSRQFELTDIFFNLCGVLIAIALFRLWQRMGYKK